jgi:hypothetical protein
MTTSSFLENVFGREFFLSWTISIVVETVRFIPLEIVSRTCFVVPVGEK